MLIFLVDENRLLTEWLKRHAHQSGESFYSMSELDQAPFFIDDLQAGILVIDGSTAAKAKSFYNALDEYPSLRQIPTLSLGESLPDWSKQLNMKGHLKKPLDPAFFFSEVRRLLYT